MRTLTVIVFALALLFPFQAAAQEALTTFTFLFIDPTIDTSHTYGNEIVRARFAGS